MIAGNHRDNSDRCLVTWNNHWNELDYSSCGMACEQYLKLNPNNIVETIIEFPCILISYQFLDELSHEMFFNPGYMTGKPLSSSRFSHCYSDLHATWGIRQASHYHDQDSHAAIRISMQPGVYDRQATIMINIPTPLFRSPCNPGYTTGKPLS